MRTGLRFGRFIYAFYLAAVILVLGLVWQCRNKEKGNSQSESTARWRNLSDSAKYVGIDACRKCHENVYQSFIQTGMGQSFGPATPKKSVGNFHHNQPIYDRYSNLYYQPYWKDSSLYVKEYRLKGRDTIHSRIEKIDYIIGSGHHTNSHIYSVNGYLYQAPFTYYVQQGKWDLPPGFEGGFNSRFNRALGSECLTCHNSYPTPVEGSFNKYTYIPHGINCERCHGPGSLHVQEKMLGRMADTTKGKPDYSIVNPKKLPYQLQIDVCQRCHMQGNAVLREGKSFFDFRPGMQLSDVMDVFMPVYEGDKAGFLMAAHAERLHKSRCFQLSQDPANPVRMNCISCHNPHISVKLTATEYFISKCRECHKDVHSSDPEVLTLAGQNCITCHMPKSGAIDIPHVTITDHYIRVVKGKEPNLLAGTGKFQGLACLTRSNPDNLTRAKAYLYFYEKFDKKRLNLDSAYVYLSQYKPEQVPALYIHYFYLKEDYSSIVKLAGQLNRTYPEPVTNYQVGQAYMNLQDYQGAMKFMRQAVKLMPLQLDYRLKLATALVYLRDFQTAEGELAFVLKENPKMASAWNDIGFIHLVRQDYDKALSELNRAIALDPDYQPALLNKIKWQLIAKNDVHGAEIAMKQFIKDYPANKDAPLLLQTIQHSSRP